MRRIASYGLFTLAVVLSMLAVLSDPSGFIEGAGFSFLIVSLFASVTGLMLTLRRPENRVGWLLSIVGAAGAMNEFVESILGGAALDPTMQRLLDVVSTGLWGVTFGGYLVLLPLWFPTGRIPSKTWGWVTPVIVVMTGLLLVGTATGTVSDDGSDALGLLVPIIWVVCGPVAALVSVVSRYRAADSAGRHQLKWLVYAFTLIVVGFMSSFVTPEELAWLSDLLALGLFAFLFVSIWLAITMRRLYEIDRLVSRTLTYALVVGLLAGLVALLATVVGTRFDSPMVVAASTLGVAAVFTPVRRWVQHRVDRRFNRSHYDVERVMDEFAGSLRDQTDPTQVVAGWVGVVSETMQPSTVGVWVRR